MFWSLPVTKPVPCARPVRARVSEGTMGWQGATHLVVDGDRGEGRVMVLECARLCVEVFCLEYLHKGVCATRQDVPAQAEVVVVGRCRQIALAYLPSGE